MSLDREQNGPTQVHPLLNYNEMNTHIQLTNGMNGIMGKSFGKLYLKTKFNSVKITKFSTIFTENDVSMREESKVRKILDFHGKFTSFLTALFERFHEKDQMKWSHA